MAGGSLERTRLPLYEFRPSREGAELAIELVPRLGIDLPLEAPTLRWNPDTGDVEAEEGRATGGAGWQLVPLETIQRIGTPHQVSNWPLQLPEDLVNDERWTMTDIEPLAAPDELEKWQQELFERRLPVQLSHMFGDSCLGQHPAHPVASLRADQDPETAWEQVRVWLAGGVETTRCLGRRGGASGLGRGRRCARVGLGTPEASATEPLAAVTRPFDPGSPQAPGRAQPRAGRQTGDALETLKVKAAILGASRWRQPSWVPQCGGGLLAVSGGRSSPPPTPSREPTHPAARILPPPPHHPQTLAARLRDGGATSSSFIVLMH